MRQVCSSGAAEKPPEINEEQVKGLHVQLTGTTCLHV